MEEIRASLVDLKQHLTSMLLRDQMWLKRLSSGITLLTIDEVVEYCSNSDIESVKQKGFSRSTIIDALNSGELQSVKVGGSRRVTRDHLASYLGVDIVKQHLENIGKNYAAVIELIRLIDSQMDQIEQVERLKSA